MTDVVLEESGTIVRLVLSRPAKRNAIGRAMCAEAVAAIDTLIGRRIAIAVLSSSEATFCAGADLSELSSGFNAPEELGRRLVESGILWVAEVRGGVLGSGVSLVAACPVVLASEEAWFCLPELGHGIYPAPVISSLANAGLSRRWAHAAAMSMRRVPAREVLPVGLVTELVPGDAGQLRQRVDEYVSALAGSGDAVEQCTRHWRASQRIDAP